MIISEFGAGAKAGFHSAEALLWSEEYQAKVYRAQLDMLPRSPLVQGMSPWVLKDFRAALRPLNGIQEFYNRKGLVDEKGSPKLAFDVLGDFYRSQDSLQPLLCRLHCVSFSARQELPWVAWAPLVES
jgi:beta-glucuronidase